MNWGANNASAITSNDIGFLQTSPPCTKQIIRFFRQNSAEKNKCRRNRQLGQSCHKRNYAIIWIITKREQSVFQFTNRFVSAIKNGNLIRMRQNLVLLNLNFFRQYAWSN